METLNSWNLVNHRQEPGSCVGTQVSLRWNLVLIWLSEGKLQDHRTRPDDALIVGLAESLQARYEHKPKDADLVESIADLFNSFQGMDHGCSGTHCRPAR